ncbi:hypothetical protein LDY19_16535 [Acinetobacter baumannii]|uniref:hypothetical protein n=1 Tax=Acinetobacter baumannii TaxID=470 RepID=UPI001CDB99F0|nr:hypothetical protein [Acinetobacter baumannii]MCA4431183.1 hypothetical protein [Acinetobacter baumannii]
MVVPEVVVEALKKNVLLALQLIRGMFNLNLKVKVVKVVKVVKLELVFKLVLESMHKVRKVLTGVVHKMKVKTELQQLMSIAVYLPELIIVMI